MKKLFPSFCELLVYVILVIAILYGGTFIYTKACTLFHKSPAIETTVTHDIIIEKAKEERQYSDHPRYYAILQTTGPVEISYNRYLNDFAAGQEVVVIRYYYKDNENKGKIEQIDLQIMTIDEYKHLEAG